ncbi:MAG: anti-sigma factor domain-containing protein [Dehalococcoidia bacterium]
MDCEEIEELAGAYALQALPQETMQEIESHLASCSAHPDIAGLRAAALSLAGAAPEREPPAALRARLLEAVRGEAASETQAVKPGAAAALPRRWAWPRLAPYAIAAVLAAAVIGLLAWNVYLQVSEDGGQQVTFVRTLTDGDTASGRVLYIQEEGVALLTVEGLAPLPAERTYQVWAMGDGDPLSIGLFATTAAGEASVVLSADLSQAEALGITVEPAGGSPLPTTDAVLTAEI